MAGFNPGLSFVPTIPNIDFAGVQAAIDQANAASSNVANITQSNAGGSGGGNYSPAAPAAPARIAPSAADTSVESLKKTSEYADYLRQRQAAEDLFKAGQATETARYGKNYQKALDELGWRTDKGQFDKGELMSSGERATASGKAYNALRNDFAARGMLQSGGFSAADALLTNQLLGQKTSTDEAKSQFEQDLASKLAAFNAEQDKAGTNALAQAKQAVLDRYASDLAAWNAGA